jgi:membrane glycosyltransferase
LETLFSVVLAPVLMLFHAHFVVATMLGRGVQWVTQRRSGDGDDTTDWREAGVVMLAHTLTGLVWLAALLAFAPALVWWMLPLLIGLIGAMPFAVLSGRVSIGQAARRRGWFAIPEELNPPPELLDLSLATKSVRPETPPLASVGRDEGLVRVVLDPYANAVHRCLLRERPGRAPLISSYFARMCEKLLDEGPQSLTQREKAVLLSDADSVDRLHLQVWLRVPREMAPCWQEWLNAYAPDSPWQAAV